MFVRPTFEPSPAPAPRAATATVSGVRRVRLLAAMLLLLTCATAAGQPERASAAAERGRWMGAMGESGLGRFYKQRQLFGQPQAGASRSMDLRSPLDVTGQ